VNNGQQSSVAIHCGLFRFATTASNRRRSAAFTVTLIPWRLPQSRMAPSLRESAFGFFRQVLSTRTLELLNRGSRIN
jgi:hypothetical protein